jgi:hypothetical protein
MGDLRVHLMGPLRIVCPHTGDLTPRGARAQAIVALLALAPSQERSRAWLQARLWSDRAPAQAAGSLRQELTKLRKLLGQEHLMTGFQRVRLAGVSVDLAEIVDRGRLPDGLLAAEVPDLLEGLEIEDEEFEDWLRVERGHWCEQVAEIRRLAKPSPPPSITPAPLERRILYLGVPPPPVGAFGHNGMLLAPLVDPQDYGPVAKRADPSSTGIADESTQHWVAGTGLARLAAGPELVGRAGGDVLVAVGPGPVVVDGGLNDDVLVGTGSGRDEIAGGTGDDVLLGGGGDDSLYGNSGNDLLSGDAGNDRLAGGAGADVFLFRISARDPPGSDIIVDYDPADDVLRFIIETGDGAMLDVDQNYFDSNDDGTLNALDDNVLLRHVSLLGEVEASLILDLGSTIATSGNEVQVYGLAELPLSHWSDPPTHRNDAGTSPVLTVLDGRMIEPFDSDPASRTVFSVPVGSDRAEDSDGSHDNRSVSLQADDDADSGGNDAAGDPYSFLI